jgi:hypothetical protein
MKQVTNVRNWGQKKKGLTRWWGKVRRGLLRNLYCSPNIITEMEHNMRAEVRKPYTVLVENSKMKIELGTPKQRCR